MVGKIDEAAGAARRESLIAPLGADGVRAQNPETRPRKIKKSPAPFCHALLKKVRKARVRADERADQPPAQHAWNGPLRRG